MEYACRRCGAISDQRRCPKHRPAPNRPRGRAHRDTRLRIADRDRWRCHLCGEPINSLSDLHVDHVTPRSQGGTDDDGNLRAAHKRCNLIRGDRLLPLPVSLFRPDRDADAQRPGQAAHSQHTASNTPSASRGGGSSSPNTPQKVLPNPRRGKDGARGEGDVRTGEGR